MIALLAIAILLLLDMQNIAARRRRVLVPGPDGSDDYTILVPLYGHPRYFANRAALETYRAHVLLVISTEAPAMSRFARKLEAEGWRVHRTDHDAALPTLVAGGLDSVTTTWTIRLDGDASFVDEPRAIVAAAEPADLCSVKIVPSRTETLIERLQAVEYATAMLSRHHRPWLTSGACMVARTAALRTILERHSNWFLGEDIETGKIARRLGFRVAHVDAQVRTQVPPTLGALTRQRRGWWAGCFRQTWINIDHGWDNPLTVVYRVVLVWLLYAGKLIALSDAWRLLPIVVVVYTGITFVSNWSVRSRWMIAYPYYALVQSLLMPPTGALEYARVAFRARSLGRYRMPLRRQRRQAFPSTPPASGGSKPAGSVGCSVG